MSTAARPLADRLRDVEDRTRSPLTGWTRDSWALLADDLLQSARAFATPTHAGIAFPGAVGGRGARVDALEGFARTFLAAGFRVAGEGGSDPAGYLDWYARGLIAGVDPASPEHWPRLRDEPQARVEAASIALVLQLTRPWLWDRLPARTQEQTVDYLSEAIGAQYPPINWLWFQIIVEQFLRSVGADVPAHELARLVHETDAFEREAGWYSDGDARAYDHYVGWALHFYPLLSSELFPSPDGEDRRARYRARAERFLGDAVRLVGADGSPLVQGRSLTYRFAAAAPFWAGARAGVASPPPGLLRRAASGIAKHFVDHGAVDERGILPIGWHGAWPALAQSYSGPGSPYWASKAFLGLSLPADHPVWTATEEPLPAESADQSFVIAAPGWLVSSRRRDGIVRVVNHGTDHARPGDVLPESPLYSRLAYSTATSPVLLPRDGALDQSVVLVDAEGAGTSRMGFERVATARTARQTLLGISRWRARRVALQPGAGDDGFARAGTVRRDGPDLEVVSLVRDGWEVRLVRLRGEAEPGLRLRVSGWAVPDDEGAEEEISTVHDLGGLGMTGVEVVAGVSPLAERVRIPWAATEALPEVRRWYAAAIGLGALGEPPRLVAADGEVVEVGWPDGTVERVDLAARLTRIPAAV